MEWYQISATMLLVVVLGFWVLRPTPPQHTIEFYTDDQVGFASKLAALFVARPSFIAYLEKLNALGNSSISLASKSTYQRLLAMQHVTADDVLAEM